MIVQHALKQNSLMSSAKQREISEFKALTTMNFQFLKKLWCCVGGRDQNKNLVLSNELIKANFCFNDNGRFYTRGLITCLDELGQTFVICDLNNAGFDSNVLF